MPDESQAFFDALFRVLRELRRNYDLSARDLGLTLSRARVITALGRQEGVTQAELAAAIGIEPPTLKRQLDALEQDGFIERRGLDGDARKRALFLTDHARSNRIAHFTDTIRAEVLEGVSREQQAELRSVLEMIAENASRLNSK